jgi:hypothetical protein
MSLALMRATLATLASRNPSVRNPELTRRHREERMRRSDPVLFSTLDRFAVARDDDLDEVRSPDERSDIREELP